MDKRPASVNASPLTGARSGRAVLGVLLCSVLVTTAAAAHPHSPLGDRSKSNRDYFIQLGEAVHGGFGPLIALGIRIGDDALRTLGVGPRQVDVTYFAGPTAPCPCIADGIMLATASSPGQGTLRVAAEKAAEGQHGRVVVRHRNSDRAVEYVIPGNIDALVRDAAQGAPDRRWDIIMAAPDARLFTKRMVDRAP